MNTVVQITKDEDKLVHTMHLLGDKTRYKIFKLLLTDERMCVSEIAGSLNISVSAVSQHFRSFEMIGLVNKERVGQKICYEICNDDEFINKLQEIIKGDQ